MEGAPQIFKGVSKESSGSLRPLQTLGAGRLLIAVAVVFTHSKDHRILRKVVRGAV